MSGSSYTDSVQKDDDDSSSTSGDKAIENATSQFIIESQNSDTRSINYGMHQEPQSWNGEEKVLNDVH